MADKQDELQRLIKDLRADLDKHVNWEHNDLTDRFPVNVRQMRKLLEIVEMVAKDEG